MSRGRRRAGLVAVVVLALFPTTAAALPDDRRERILGHDGVEYPSAPFAVDGGDGDFYLGLELDLACAYGGELLEKGMTRLARLARIIEDSGRRVVFTVAPVKSVVMPPAIPASALPQGPCTASGLEQQREVLDAFADDNYVSVRTVLARDRRRSYWRTDPHWTAVGASDWAVAVATELDPRLARRQRYRPTTETRLGYLDVPETVRSVEYAGRVTVRTAPRSPAPVGSEGSDVRWRSRPGGRTWPGRTLLLGDSFTVVGMDLLAPLFRRGRFLWTGNIPAEVTARAIADADTVVIEVVQLFAYGNPLGQVSFRRMVERALR